MTDRPSPSLRPATQFRVGRRGVWRDSWGGDEEDKADRETEVSETNTRLLFAFLRLLVNTPSAQTGSCINTRGGRLILPFHFPVF